MTLKTTEKALRYPTFPSLAQWIAWHSAPKELSERAKMTTKFPIEYPKISFFRFLVAEWQRFDSLGKAMGAVIVVGVVALILVVVVGLS